MDRRDGAVQRLWLMFELCNLPVVFWPPKHRMFDGVNEAFSLEYVAMLIPRISHHYPLSQLEIIFCKGLACHAIVVAAHGMEVFHCISSSACCWWSYSWTASADGLNGDCSRMPEWDYCSSCARSNFQYFWQKQVLLTCGTSCCVVPAHVPAGIGRPSLSHTMLQWRLLQHCMEHDPAVCNGGFYWQYIVRCWGHTV
jgi:hypothetical protein